MVINTHADRSHVLATSKTILNSVQNWLANWYLMRKKLSQFILELKMKLLNLIFRIIIVFRNNSGLDPQLETEYDWPKKCLSKSVYVFKRLRGELG